MIQHHWSLTIRLYSVICRTLIYLVSYPGHIWGSYPSPEMQSVSSTALDDWASPNFYVEGWFFFITVVIKEGVLNFSFCVCIFFNGKSTLFGYFMSKLSLLKNSWEIRWFYNFRSTANEIAWLNFKLPCINIADLIINLPYRTRGCPRGLMVKAMNCGIVVREFVLQSRYYVHFRANTLGKGMNPHILPPAMGK